MSIKGLEFVNCKNVSVSGLAIDYDPLPWIQAQITEINSDTENEEYYFTAELMEGFSLVESGVNQLFFFKEDGSYISPVGAEFQD